MKVGIFINTTKSEANTTASAFSKTLQQNGIDYKIVNLKEDFKDIDVITVFGGDGTILRVIEYALEFDVPILAVNIGTVGFLSCVESNELEKAVELIKDKAELDKRSVLKVKINGVKYYALNECLVQRYNSNLSTSEVAKLSLSIGGNFVDKYFADGMIISTPTGSTAYSLSCGGSIMTPDLSAFIATPVCSHSLHSRPIVYPDSYQAEVKVLENSSKCALYIDGKYVKSLNRGDVVEVSRSRKTVKFFKTDDNFFEKLLIKLNKWSETR
ncbi:MAG: NAD(+)/NADH kinase [Clostridia bacterium]|nr:NAD(+)/NADH kinase [Clostridia bacterium]